MNRIACVKIPVIPKSRLHGWNWLKSLIGKCPICKRRATLGNPAYSKKWRVCCVLCKNPNLTGDHDNPLLAIHEWNLKYAERNCER